MYSLFELWNFNEVLILTLMRLLLIYLVGGRTCGVANWNFIRKSLMIRESEIWKIQEIFPTYKSKLSS